MKNLGAEVIKVNGNYEKSLIECIKQSTENGWQIVQDVLGIIIYWYQNILWLVIQL